MPDDTLPKTKNSADWLSYADQKEQEFKNYHSATNAFGQLKNPSPLQDDYSKLLSQHALDARKMGMDLLRKERSEDNAKTMASYRKGGRAEKSGPAKLHKGEAIARKPTRKSPRKSAR